MDLKLLVTRVTFRLASRRSIHGITVASPASRNDCQVLFQKCEQAFALIRDHDPRTYRYLQSCVRSLLVFGDPSAKGYWIEDLKMIELQEDWLKDPKTTVEWAACVIVHETTHARLRKLGIGYEEKDRPRVERICCRAQRNFARRLSDATYLVEHYERRLSSICETEFSDEARRQAKLKALEELGCPALVKRWVERRIRKAATGKSEAGD